MSLWEGCIGDNSAAAEAFRFALDSIGFLITRLDASAGRKVSVTALHRRRGPCPANAELLHPRLKGAALQPESSGGTLRSADHPVGRVQRLQNVAAFHLFQCLRLPGC